MSFHVWRDPSRRRMLPHKTFNIALMGRPARPFPPAAAGDSPTRGYAGPPGNGYRNSLRSEPVTEGN